MAALLSNPQVIAAILSILGTLVGYLLKRWITGAAEKEHAAEVLKQEIDDALKQSTDVANDTARVNESIKKQNQAADKWFNP